MLDKQIIEIINEMIRNGIMSTVKMSEILEREHGLKIAPHFISEYLFRDHRERKDDVL